MSKRKGVEGIIAVVLLLMITVAVAGAAFMWLTKMQREIQDDVNKQQQEMMDKARAGLTITSVWKPTTSGNIKILLRNSGRYSFSDDEIDKIEIYWNGKYRDTLFGYFTENTAAGTCDAVGLAPGESCTAETNIDAWPGNLGDYFTLRLDEPTTGAKATKYCRINEADQESC